MRDAQPELMRGVELNEREPWLWWVAGADAEILGQCPRADQIFVQHLGISLIGAFLFVFLITSVAMVVAFPGLQALSNIIVAIGFGLLIATMVFLIDRLFIQADWDWQASRQRRELARAAWEQGHLRDKVAARIPESYLRQFFRSLGRLTTIFFRVLLSAAIGLTIASFLELVLYKDELKTLIERHHYEENKIVYDEINDRKQHLDQEIANALKERNRLQTIKADLEGELNKLELSYVPLPSDKDVARIEGQIQEVRGKINEEQAKVRRYAENIRQDRI